MSAAKRGNLTSRRRTFSDSWTCLLGREGVWTTVSVLDPCAFVLLIKASHVLVDAAARFHTHRLPGNQED